MKLIRTALMFVAAALMLVAVSVPAQNLTLLHTFSATTSTSNWDGVEPRVDLVLSNNMLYGTAPIGGSNGYGTVFCVTTNGTNFSVLHTFSGGADGAMPNKNLVLSGNLLYGMVGQGTNLAGFGSVFCLDITSGNFSLVYTFSTNSDGALGQPNGGLVLCGDTLYGTAYQGGISNAGSIFSINTNGTFQPLHLFDAATDGENPLGVLVLSDGTLYGTTRNGGTNGGPYGTVFSISTNGDNFRVLHTFAAGISDAHNPDAGLVLSGDTLYGTTAFGGTNNHGTVFSISTNGDDYAILHSFSGAGEISEGGLVLQSNMVYGTTLGDGTSTSGTIFSLDTDDNTFTTLYTFSAANSSDGYTNSTGAQPYDSLALAGNILYGTTFLGGAAGNGTVFSLAIVPTISSLNLEGTNLVLDAVNGVAGENCAVLASADPTLPLSQWTPLTTNALMAGGDFSITVTNAAYTGTAAQFFSLKMQ